MQGEVVMSRSGEKLGPPAQRKFTATCLRRFSHSTDCQLSTATPHVTTRRRIPLAQTETPSHSAPKHSHPTRAFHTTPLPRRNTHTMDPETNLPDLTDDLALTIDDLEDALAPILASPLPTLTSTLPTLDKAKLHILTAYTLESLLFSALQASGADAKSHRIFPELARLKTYFGKVSAAEAAGEGKGNVQGPTTKLDKDAAARFIRHGLSGNERYDKERAERLAKEKARAALKARLIGEKVNRKFDDDVESAVQEELGKKRKAAVEADNSDEDDDDDDEEMEEPEAQAQTNVDAAGSEEDHVDSENAEFYGEDAAPVDTPGNKLKKDKKDKKDKRSSKRRRSGVKVISNDAAPPKRKAKEPIARKSMRDDRPQELILPERGEEPRTRGETFNALLAGTFAEHKKEKKKSKKGKKA